MGVRILRDEALSAHLQAVDGRIAVVGLPGCQRCTGPIEVQARGLFVAGSCGPQPRGAAAHIHYSESFARAFALSAVIRWSPEGLLLRIPDAVEVASIRGSPRSPDATAMLHLVGEDRGYHWHHTQPVLDRSEGGVAFLYPPGEVWLVVGEDYEGVMDLGSGVMTQVEVNIRRVARTEDGNAIAGATVTRRSA